MIMGLTGRCWYLKCVGGGAAELSHTDSGTYGYLVHDKIYNIISIIVQKAEPDLYWTIENTVKKGKSQVSYAQIGHIFSLDQVPCNIIDF